MTPAGKNEEGDGMTARARSAERHAASSLTPRWTDARNSRQASSGIPVDPLHVPATGFEAGAERPRQMSGSSGCPEFMSGGSTPAVVAGAGHFVKMVHNGVEYALMAAYAEGFNILAHANVGARARPADAESAPLRLPEHYQYDIPLPDLAGVWRRESVIGPRWTANAAIESSTPAPVLTAALFQRFSSRGEDDLLDRLLSAMRYQFGGHLERAAET
jgi:6-phosphogluconate dehydrogenase, C-terminal domain